MIFNIGLPNDKQKLFFKDRHRYVAFGGARGGGKSWAVRSKATLLGLNHSGIRILIVRQTFPELEENHIRYFRDMPKSIGRYNESKKVFKFCNSSTIKFLYCASDKDLTHFQGAEYDIIFVDEATNLSEYQLKVISACNRGTGDFPRRTYYTCNPSGQGVGYIKRLFIDRRFEDNEDPEDYSFIQSLVTDNKVLMEKDPEYIKRLEALPSKLRAGWLHGDWNSLEGMFFEEFVDSLDNYQTRRWTHVIEPFEIPIGWTIYRSYDFGYAKPFALSWWAIDYDGRLY
ncbi:MAG: hypothetical protein HUJ71_05505, partial [Pseudobutyrivibrio sp.]|nr:hypothetical protein [Pseudobutyrivibrio sp.]